MNRRRPGLTAGLFLFPKSWRLCVPDQGLISKRVLPVKKHRFPALAAPSEPSAIKFVFLMINIRGRSTPTRESFKRSVFKFKPLNRD
jgi:hypothetical protein